ncbi:MAG: zinc dependent phospholipase C family protein, partial [Actinomycetota bacterium]|nr:zinc dependent phospholipase C family protein [Actinomycetota bacterium]
MPGHFTHIYMARRLADWLSSQKSFNPDDVVGMMPGEVSEALGAEAVGLMGSANQLTPERAAKLMRDWPKFTALGAVGPDLFFYCQDFSSESFTEHPFPDDLLMLAMRVVYSLGRNSHESMRPLAALLAEANQVFAGIVRVLIKLESVWDDFLSVYSGAIDPVTNLLAAAVDSVSGGVVTEAGKAFDNVLNGIKRVLAEEVATSDDFFAPFALRARNGWDEKSFAWSDMLHYRKTSQMPRNLLIEASRQFDLDHDRAKFEQFQAFALGWISHVGTDVIGHSFVNEQAGGPFRTHWQRHHLVENHMDAWVYREAGEGGCLTSDALGANDIYPDIGQSALAFALALDDANPNGRERPVTLPADAMEARDAVELSGEMPQWLAEGILRAMIATYHVGGDTEPENLGGDDFSITSPSTLAALENLLTGADVTVNEPLGQLVERIVKPAGFDVPRGYPQPWEIQVSYRFMLTYYQLAFWGGFDLARPRSPAFIEWPSVTSKPSEPSSASPEARSSNEGSPSWAMDVLGKLGGDIGPGLQRLGEIVRAASSPGSFPLRYALYQIAL